MKERIKKQIECWLPEQDSFFGRTANKNTEGKQKKNRKKGKKKD